MNVFLGIAIIFVGFAISVYLGRRFGHFLGDLCYGTGKPQPSTHVQCNVEIPASSLNLGSNREQRIEIFTIPSNVSTNPSYNMVPATATAPTYYFYQDDHPPTYDQAIQSSFSTTSNTDSGRNLQPENTQPLFPSQV